MHAVLNKALAILTCIIIHLHAQKYLLHCDGWLPALILQQDFEDDCQTELAKPSWLPINQPTTKSCPFDSTAAA